MTSTVDESELEELRRKDQLRQARRLRERANRVGTNLRPHVKEEVFRLAEETKVAPRTMVRILLHEALEGRGTNLNDLHKAWKERNPNDSEDDDE